MVTNNQVSGLQTRQVTTKRLFDFLVSLLGLLAFAPVIVIAWCIASIDTRSNGFYFQKRVGQFGKMFYLIKIKTMRNVEGIDTTITSVSDVRITPIGAFFRKTKIDELPQLWNVLFGKMSFVGPRPDVPGYADKLEGDDRVVLTVRPGITGPASLKYKDEEKILARQANPKRYNDEVIWPDKIRINREYIENYSCKKEFYYIWETIKG